MTSLEFVNDRIRSYETMLLTAIDTKCSVEQIKHYEEKLNMLQQIKAELEAWEVAKTDSVILAILEDLADGESINYHRLSKEKQETLKKALEVQNG